MVIRQPSQPCLQAPLHPPTPPGVGRGSTLRLIPCNQGRSTHYTLEQHRNTGRDGGARWRHAFQRGYHGHCEVLVLCGEREVAAEREGGRGSGRERGERRDSGEERCKSAVIAACNLATGAAEAGCPESGAGAREGPAMSRRHENRHVLLSFSSSPLTGGRAEGKAIPPCNCPDTCRRGCVCETVCV